ncbi:MAG: hypothetical protein LBS59_06035 [Puniceicoccales bacterium]|nr:hypothetical protein [Puniceicoccales bacterium]
MLPVVAPFRGAGGGGGASAGSALAVLALHRRLFTLCPSGALCQSVVCRHWKRGRGAADTSIDQHVGKAI